MKPARSSRPAKDPAATAADRLSRATSPADVFAALVDRGLDTALVLDMNGIVRYARPGAERVLGWDDAQLVGSSLAAIPGGEAIPLHIGQADALELDNPGDPAEVDLQAADGHAIALEFVVTRTLYDGESLLVVNVRTLTSQRSSRLAAPWSHAHSQALLDAMPDQILRFDRDGRYLGSAGATSAGSPFTDETLGKTFREVLPATLAALCEDAITIAMTGGGVQTLRYSNARANGVRQFETRISVVASREVLAIVRDVTDQTEATAGLERLVQILDATPDFICSFVPDGEVEYTNAAFRRLFADRRRSRKVPRNSPAAEQRRDSGGDRERPLARRPRFRVG